MNRNEAVVYAHTRLKEFGLSNWSVRLTTDMTQGFLGLCSHRDECIILSAQHIDIHDDKMIKNTINHEIAHALTPGHSHDTIWKAKAAECGCYHLEACSNLSFSPEAIDAIRSGATLEFEVEETIIPEQIIRTPKYTVTRLQEKCPECKKVATEKRRWTIEKEDKDIQFIQFECGHITYRNIPKATPFHKFISADADENCKHEWNKTFCLNCDAKRPSAFQIEGMRFLEKALATNKGALLADEMGLGKTPQTLGYLKYHPEEIPILAVVKSGLLFQWMTQSVIWLGYEYAGQIIRKSNTPIIPGLKIYFISYDLLIPKARKGKNGKIIQQGYDIQKLIDHKFKVMILDECQLVKNVDSSRTQQVRRLAKEIPHIIPLSGTPWKNKGSEFYPVLNMIAPYKFNSEQGFKNRWVDYYYDGNKYKEGGIRNIPEFKEYVKDIILRREYDEVMDEFPDVNRTLNYTDLDEVTQSAYDHEESEFVKWWNSKIIGGEDPTVEFGSDNVMAKLARMRHILGLAKIAPTFDYVEEFIEDTERKLCIFVHHVDVGQILFKRLTERYGNEIPILKLSSDMGPEERFKMQEEFNNSKRAILIASTLAAGEGINLQTCSDAVLVERQWNPANEDQAAPGRFKRIGQLSKVVNVVCVTGYQTIDDYLHRIVERKRGHFHALMNKGEVPAWNAREIMRELGEAIVKSHNDKKRGAA